MEEQKKNGISFISGNWPLDPDKPTLVFIHGANLSRLLWKKQVEALAGIANTVAIDLPGHGKSEGQGLDRIDSYAEVVRKFIENEKLPQPVPCGLSMGGAITQHLISSKPDLFSRAILISTGARLKVLPVIFESIKKNYSYYLGMLEKISLSDKSDPKILKELMNEAAMVDPETAMGDFTACNGFDIIDRLHEINTKVLVISAEDDMVTPLKYGEFLEENIPGAERVQIKDAGHLVPLEKPEEVNKAITEFLGK